MLSAEQRGGKNGAQGSVELIGRSPQMQQVGEMIERVSGTDVPVLICGESGAGKEVVARLIHLRSSRRQKPFLKVNCAAIPRDLLESELFGYERGSFTGAFNSKPGTFELAQGGTIFLDEISEMALSVQAKLLQVLQDRQFCRLGAEREIAVDVRFISSTHRPLELLLSEGKFREDFYYRLNVITIRVPPLRERKEDIPELAGHLLRKHASAADGRDLALSDRLVDAFRQYDWPGNVRELENVLRRVQTLGEEAVLSDGLPKMTPEPSDPLPSPKENDPPLLSLKEVARRAARQAEQDMILRALHKTNWNRKRAAALLKISYKAMLYKLKAAGLAKHSRTVYSS